MKTKDTAPASLETAACDNCAAKIARNNLLAANQLALVLQKHKTDFVAEAFVKLILLCQLSWSRGAFRTGTDALLYESICEWYADNYQNAILPKRD